ncbi:RHS repeat protein, partial [Affinibrenneria salicis]
MAADLTAARAGDPLVHTSLLADFAAGLTEGLIYTAVFAAAGAMAGTGLGAVAGLALLAGAMTSGLPEAAGNLVASGVDAALDFFGLRGPPDATITSGSPDVHIMGKPAARAAGTVSHDVLNAPDGDEDGPGPAAFAMMLAGSLAASLHFAARNPQAAAAALLDGAGSLLKDGLSALTPASLSALARETWADLTQPVTESASPHAIPASHDTVLCQKSHVITGPGNFIAEGSKKVLINGQPAARRGDRSTCEATIQPAESPRVRIGGGSIVVRDIRSGRNIMMYMLGAIIGSLGVGELRNLFSCVSLRRLKVRLPCLLAGMALSESAGALAAVVAGRVHPAAQQTPHPVHIATGIKLLAGEAECDFALDGRMPLVWQRVYQSANPVCGALGAGWMLPFETRLLCRPAQDGQRQFFWRDPSGRECGLGDVQPGTVVYFQEDGLTLYFTRQGVPVLQTDDGEFQLYEPDPLRDGEWRLLQTADRHMNLRHYRYNDAGRLVHIRDDNDTLAARLSYDARHGRLSAVHQECEGESRLLAEYRYNERGQLTSVRDADGIVTRRYQWDAASGMMAAHSHATGLTLRYDWQPPAQADGHWRVCGYRVQDEDGNSLEQWLIDADETRRRAAVTCLSGGSSEHRWDDRCRITAYTDPYGARWQYEQADEGERLLSVTDPDGRHWRYDYDGRGNLTGVHDPAGGTHLTTWHPVWALPLTEVLPDGAVWRYEYSPQGDLTALTAPDGGVTRFSYNDRGDLLTRTDAGGSTLRLRPDARGLPVRSEDCSGYPSHYRYDAAGRLTAETDAQGNVTRYAWSPAGRLQSETRPDGRETRYEYDAAGLPAAEITGGLAAYRVRRNVRGQVVAATGPSGRQVRRHYDRFGRLTALENPNGERWRFEYDTGHRLLAQTDYAGRATRYTWTRLGQPASVTREPLAQEGAGAPLTSRYEYDARGRLTARDTAQHRTEYSWRPREIQIRRTALSAWRQARAERRESDWDETLAFGYDAAGNLLSEDNHGGRWQHRYDIAGNLTATTLPDGRELSRLYYGSGHLLQMSLRGAGGTHDIAGYRRDRLHREISRTQGALTRDTRYDSAGRVTLRRTSRGNRLVLEQRCQWDQTDRLVQQILTDGDAAPADKYRRRMWGYDADGCLTQGITGRQAEHFYHDAAGNRTDSPGETVWCGLLQRLNGLRLSYDAFGRLSRRCGRDGTVQHFRYDDEQRVSDVTLEGHPEYRRAEYRYDALGRRTHKILHRHGEAGADAEVITFLWSGMRLAGEQSSRT